jgi:hypothetical protein
MPWAAAAAAADNKLASMKLGENTNATSRPDYISSTLIGTDIAMH